MIDFQRLWYIWECAPIEFWHWTLSTEEHLRRLAEWGEDEENGETIAVLAAELRSGILAIASRTCWEGDGTIRVGSWPDFDTSSMSPIVIIKQHNNGSTFVASRIQLPTWVEQHDYCGRSDGRSRPLPTPVARRITELDELVERLMRERLPVT